MTVLLLREILAIPITAIIALTVYPLFGVCSSARTHTRMCAACMNSRSRIGMSVGCAYAYVLAVIMIFGDPPCIYRHSVDGHLLFWDEGKITPMVFHFLKMVPWLLALLIGKVNHTHSAHSTVCLKYTYHVVGYLWTDSASDHFVETAQQDVYHGQKNYVSSTIRRRKKCLCRCVNCLCDTPTTMYPIAHPQCH
jgi:hypothetical protein